PKFGTYELSMSISRTQAGCCFKWFDYRLSAGVKVFGQITDSTRVGLVLVSYKGDSTTGRLFMKEAQAEEVSQASHQIELVGATGLEPARVTSRGPKPRASAIPPRAQSFCVLR